MIGKDEFCHGGLPARALKFIHREGGVDTEESYPYTSHDIGSFFVSIQLVLNIAMQ